MNKQKYKEQEDKLNDISYDNYELKRANRDKKITIVFILTILIIVSAISVYNQIKLQSSIDTYYKPALNLSCGLNNKLIEQENKIYSLLKPTFENQTFIDCDKVVNP